MGVYLSASCFSASVEVGSGRRRPHGRRCRNCRQRNSISYRGIATAQNLHFVYTEDSSTPASPTLLCPLLPSLSDALSHSFICSLVKYLTATLWRYFEAEAG